MPQLTKDLGRLVSIPSLAEWGFPEHTREPLVETYDALVGLFRSAGVERIESLELPGAAPILTGEIPAPTCDAWPMAPNRRPRA